VTLGIRRLSVEVETVGGNTGERPFLLYVPAYYVAEKPLPLWILPPGAFNTPEKQIAMSEMVQYAEQQQVAFVALDGQDKLMNVVKNSQPNPSRWDDVAYTKAVVAKARQELCVDPKRIFCLGYSRGARFCSRLASEYSEVIAGIAPVSGLRFPNPHNMTRPMPIITFHGTDDPINPYGGNGNPEYWYDSVEVAVGKWVKFNGCTRNDTYRLTESVTIYSYTSCKENADVVFVKIAKGGHTWPGSRFPFDKSLHMVSRDVNASVMIGSFFNRHPFAVAPHIGEPEEPSSGYNPVLIGLLGVVLGMIIMAMLQKIFCPSSGDDSSDDESGEDSDLEKSS